MNRILNIVTDQKFIDRIIERHDAIDTFSEHEYVIVGKKRDLNYIKSIDRIKFIKESEFFSFLSEGNFSGVFLHNLYALPLALTPLIPSDIKVFWKIWGFDIYSSPISKPLVKVNLYHSLTKKFITNSHTVFFRLKVLLKELLGINKRNCDIYYKAVERIDYVAGVLPFEYDLIKKAEPKLRLSKIDYSYSHIEDLNSKEIIEPNEGNSLLIGNSADLTNNHLDVLSVLETLHLKDRYVYVPLSYSGSQNYVKTVVDYGQRIFGDYFKPLTTFMPLDDYKKMLKSCGYCIFFHERQQAVGNIELMLKKGSKVFLSETNPTYHFYKGLGVNIFSIQKDLDEKGLTTPLTIEQVQHNVTVLRSYETVDTETEKLRIIAGLCLKKQ